MDSYPPDRSGHVQAPANGSAMSNGCAASMSTDLSSHALTALERWRDDSTAAGTGKSRTSPHASSEDTFDGLRKRRKPVRIVRVERDYSSASDAALPQFYAGWLLELEPDPSNAMAPSSREALAMGDEKGEQGRALAPLEYVSVMNDLNAALARAHARWPNIRDNILAVLSLYISPYLLGSHYARVRPLCTLYCSSGANSRRVPQSMSEFDKIIEQANEQNFHPARMHMCHPRECAFLYVRRLLSMTIISRHKRTDY